MDSHGRLISIKPPDLSVLPCQIQPRSLMHSCPRVPSYFASGPSGHCHHRKKHWTSFRFQHWSICDGWLQQAPSSISRWDRPSLGQIPQWNSSQTCRRHFMVRFPAMLSARMHWTSLSSTSVHAPPSSQTSSRCSLKMPRLRRTPCGTNRSRCTQLSTLVCSHGATASPSSGRSSPVPINKDTPNRLHRWMLTSGSRRWQRYRMLRSHKKAPGHMPTTSTGL